MLVIVLTIMSTLMLLRFRGKYATFEFYKFHISKVKARTLRNVFNSFVVSTVLYYVVL